MGKIINLSEYNNSRKTASIEKVDFETLSFKNKEGNSVIVKPLEVKSVLREYVAEELSLYADDVIANNKFKLTNDVNNRMLDFEERLNKHIDEKIDSLTERIMEKIVSRTIEEEVNKLLGEKLLKLKELL